MPIEAATLELYINQGAFEELGIELPEDRQFAADEFMEVAQKCIIDGGYDVFAGGMQWWGSGALPFFDATKEYWREG
jgi:ABC-type glycerol-3-phosphate transport system substrate-binding protein